MVLGPIDPMTDGVLRVHVENAAAALVDDATVVADVYSPFGKKVDTAVPLTNAGSGNYDLAIDPAWSAAPNGAVIQGEFRALITVTRGAVQATERVRFLIAFTD